MQLTQALPAWYRSVNRRLSGLDPHDAPIRAPMTQVVLVGPYRPPVSSAQRPFSFCLPRDNLLCHRRDVQRRF